MTREQVFGGLPYLEQIVPPQAEDIVKAKK